MYWKMTQNTNSETEKKKIAFFYIAIGIIMKAQ